jgi:SAM-dependent methyltransferase
VRAYYPQYYDPYFVGVPGDLEHYVDRAQAAGGDVLELGCGTGRILVPVAAAGVPVVGLEPDQELLECASQRLQDSGGGAAECARLVSGRMETLDLGERFHAVMAPYRAFQHLLTPVDQEEALTRIHEHLVPDGLLLLDTYDPLMEVARGGLSSGLTVDTDFVLGSSGNRVTVWYTRRVDPQVQLLEQEFIFEEVDADGAGLGRTHAQLVLRYAARYELEYLLELCGFVVEELYGGFSGEPYPGYGNQVWVARRV